MPKARNKAVDYLTYLAARVFTMFIHMFAVPTNYRTARWIGDFLFRIDKRHRLRAIEHLRRSFPQWPEDRLTAVAHESMRNLIYMGLEVLFTTRLITPSQWRKHIELDGMGDIIRRLVERKTGFIMLTGHFGNWEVVGYTMATLGFPVNAVARRLDNPFLNEFILGVRERTGMRILDKKGATVEMDEILTSRDIVAFIADQDAGRKGMFVDFFGRPASTYKSIGLLAMQYNVPVIVGYGRRLDDNFRFRMGVQRVIEPHEWADQPDPLRWITQEYTTALEEVIRTAPEQYLWVHRRWKHRPKGEADPVDGIA